MAYISTSTKHRIRTINDMVLNPDMQVTPKEVFILYKDALLYEHYRKSTVKNFVRAERMRKNVHVHLSQLELREEMKHL